MGVGLRQPQMRSPDSILPRNSRLNLSPQTAWFLLQVWCRPLYTGCKSPCRRHEGTQSTLPMDTIFARKFVCNSRSTRPRKKYQRDQIAATTTREPTDRKQRRQPVEVMLWQKWQPIWTWRSTCVQKVLPFPGGPRTNVLSVNRTPQINSCEAAGLCLSQKTKAASAWVVVILPAIRWPFQQGLTLLHYFHTSPSSYGIQNVVEIPAVFYGIIKAFMISCHQCISILVTRWHQMVGGSTLLGFCCLGVKQASHLWGRRLEMRELQMGGNSPPDKPESQWKSHWLLTLVQDKRNTSISEDGHWWNPGGLLRNMSKLFLVTFCESFFFYGIF